MEVCNKETGGCLCKANFTGQICEQCAPGFFNHPTCEPCACDPIGVVYNGWLLIKSRFSQRKFRKHISTVSKEIYKPVFVLILFI